MARRSQFIDHDILETLEDFIQGAEEANITIETIELKGKEKIQYAR